MRSKEYIKGTIKTIVLKLLSEKKKMYGYEINQRVKELSKGEIELTYGALYPILYKLENEGLLVTESEIVEGRVRKYYSLTKQGNVTAKEKVAELDKFVDVIKAIIAPAPKPSVKLSILYSHQALFFLLQTSLKNTYVPKAFGMLIFFALPEAKITATYATQYT